MVIFVSHVTCKESFSLVFVQILPLEGLSFAVFLKSTPVFKGDGQEKSSKISISWQELKNRFLSFVVHR